MAYHLWSWFLMFECSKVKYCHSQRSPTITNSKEYGSNGIPKITKYNQWFPDIASAAQYIHFWLGIHTVTIDVGCSQPAANITDISCWAGFHLQYSLCVNVFSYNDPVQQGYAQMSHPLCQVSAAGTTTVHTRLGTSICVTSWPANPGDCLPSVHLDGSWML